MLSRRRRALMWSGFAAVEILTGACWTFQGVRPEALDIRSHAPTARWPLTVASPTKAHVVDGSTIIYPNGFWLGSDTVVGAGSRYDIRGNSVGAVSRMSLDSVVAMESYTTRVRVAPTLIASVLTTGAVVGGGAVLAKALFGSCPTTYSDSAGHPVLEAESFSYSIARLFERRTVDRLRAQPDATGQLTLQVRNEALETHYINHLELLEAAHAPDEIVLPDVDNHVVAVGPLTAPSRAVDRAGRDVLPSIRAEDGEVFRTAAATLHRARAGDFNDYIDLTLPAPTGAQVALVFTLRNSLLNTVLLYDQMLGASGARALDWLNSDLANISHATALGRWYGSRMGMTITVRHGTGQGATYDTVAYVPDAGPIAWRHVAAVIPVPVGNPAADSLHLRLSFVADQWRIDRVAIAAAVRTVTPRRIAPMAITGSDGTADSAALANLREADDRYLETHPGQRFLVHFDVGPAAPGHVRTFLLAAQGYYTEWIRAAWIRSAKRQTTFTPSDSALVAALRQWESEHDAFEHQFATTRIPTQ